MKKIKIQLFTLLLILTFSSQISARNSEKEIRLKIIEYEMVVNVAPEKAWEILASYGDVGTYHAGLNSSSSINGSPNEAEMDCERICYIPRTKRKEIMVKEKIIAIKEGEYYTYDVYEWENFPIKKMHNTFGVKTNDKGETVIYQITNFRMKPGFLTGLMKGRLRKGAREALISYKHYMETGEKRVALKELKKTYKAF